MQQLGLQPDRQLRDLVQEDGPAVGELEAADASVAAPVKAPFAWPKSSLSNSEAARAGQLVLTNKWLRRELRLWMQRAR